MKTANLTLVGLNLTDEFEGSEVEAKINFSPPDPAKLIRLTKKHIESNGSVFETVPGKKKILDWTYFFDRYGLREKGKLIESYSLIYHPQKQKFWIKSKSLPSPDDSRGYLKRKESIIRIERGISEEDKDLISKLKTEELGGKPMFLGTIKRRKIYLLLRHSQSGRYYSVSADKCLYQKFSLSQIEVEYKGIDETKYVKNLLPSLEETVGKEIKILVDFLIEKLSEEFLLKRTKRTKFDWLCSCLAQEKNR